MPPPLPSKQIWSGTCANAQPRRAVGWRLAVGCRLAHEPRHAVHARWHSKRCATSSSAFRRALTWGLGVRPRIINRKGKYLKREGGVAQCIFFFFWSSLARGNWLTVASTWLEAPFKFSAQVPVGMTFAFCTQKAPRDSPTVAKGWESNFPDHFAVILRHMVPFHHNYPLSLIKPNQHYALGAHWASASTAWSNRGTSGGIRLRLAQCFSSFHGPIHTDLSLRGRRERWNGGFVCRQIQWAINHSCRRTAST